MDRFQNVPDRPALEANPQRLRFERQLIKSKTVFLDTSQRQLVLGAIRQHCSHRGWVLHAAHVRSNHVHVVAWANNHTRGGDVAAQALCLASFEPVGKSSATTVGAPWQHAVSLDGRAGGGGSRL